MMLRALCLALSATLPVQPVLAVTLSGPAEVVDGDTLAIRGEQTRIRLYGIDAPEGQQTCEDAAGQRYLCGSRASEALAALIGRNGQVSCEEEDRDRYGRVVAVCTVAGRSLNAEMVRQGWAVEYTQYSDGRFSGEEAEARRARRGLWAGTFVRPSEWRRGERLGSEAPTGAERTCAIKGNISGSGKVYHLPGSRGYAATRIDEAKGERWFCSEDEAQAAGWRAPAR